MMAYVIICSLCIIAIEINIVECLTIISYLRSKPPGHKTFFDLNLIRIFSLIMVGMIFVGANFLAGLFRPLNEDLALFITALAHISSISFYVSLFYITVIRFIYLKYQYVLYERSDWQLLKIISLTGKH